MSLDWDNLRFFLAVSRTRSFGGAAKLLNVTQATVSRRIATLEESLGVLLVHRSRPRISLSDEGQKLIANAEQIEALVLDLRHDSERASNIVHGNVRLATLSEIASYLLVPSLGDLRKRFPALTLELVESTALVNLTRREADIALRLGRPDYGELVVSKLLKVPCGLYAAPTYLDSVDDPTDLESMRWLELDSSLSHAPEIRWLNKNARNRSVFLRSGNIETLARAARQGLGVTILPHRLAQLTEGIIRINNDDVVSHAIWLVVHKEIVDLPRIRAVTSWIRRTLR